MGLGESQGRDHLIRLTTQAAFDAYEGVRHRLPPARGSGACAVAGNLDDIADGFDVFLLDAFGVLNIGESAIAGVPDRVARLQAAGKRVLVVTNAASYPHAALLSKYARLGYAFAPEDVISSRKTLLHAVSLEPNRHWGLMAPEDLGRENIGHLDLEFLGDDPAVYDRAEGFLLLGSGSWTAQRQALLLQSLADNARPVLVGNPDIVAPREAGFSTEPGFYAHQIGDQTGVAPQFFGKPFQNIYDQVFARLGPGIDPGRIVMVGDSLHTDVLGAQTAGVASALIAGYGFFDGADAGRAIEASGIRPDFILERP